MSRIEDYAACWIEVDATASGGQVKNEMIVLGTDSQYYMNGQKISLAKR